MTGYTRLAQAADRRFFTSTYTLANPFTGQSEEIRGSCLTIITRDYTEDNSNSPILGGGGSFGRILQVFVASEAMVPHRDYNLTTADGRLYPITTVIPWPHNDSHHYQIFLKEDSL